MIFAIVIGSVTPVFHLMRISVEVCSFNFVVTIPRIIIRDLSDHADKRELVKVFSRYNSYKNAWIANNPPGFAYIFFNNMKDAIRAVAATNGGILCGNRVRVELTPIDEAEDNKYHMNARGRRRGGGGYRRPHPPSRSPPPPGSPVPRYKRRSSPSPRRYSERGCDTSRESPVRSRSPVPRHVPYRPRYDRKERNQKDFEFQQYATESASHHAAGKSYSAGPIKELYRDHHNHDDKYETLNSSLDRSPNLYRSRDVHYDNEHTHEIFREEFQQSKSHSSTGNSGRSRRRSYDENYHGTKSSTWNIDVEGNQYYYPSSPPSPLPLHSAELQYVGRNNDHYPKYKSRGSDKSFSRNSRYDVQQDIVYTSTYPLSPSPPPPPSPPIPRNEDRSSRRRPSRSREERQKSWKGKESNSDHHHSHKVQRHRSRSPPLYYTRDHNEYVTSSMVNDNSSVPNRELDEYHLKSRSTSKQYKKALPVTDCKAEHSPLVYEQIEEGTDGFFSEVGYHSPLEHPPKDYIQTVDGRDYTAKEDTSSRQQQQVYIEEGPFELTRTLQESYEDQFLEIDEVKGNVEGDESGLYSRDVDHQLGEREVVYSKEREVLHKKRHHQEREVLHRNHEREVIVNRSPVRNRFVCL